jgi:hypothetical protein
MPSMPLCEFVERLKMIDGAEQVADVHNAYGEIVQ